MNAATIYQSLAEKFVFKESFPDVLVGDSLLAMVKFLFTEEEAHIVYALSVAPQPAKSVARAVHRPVEEVRPILASMADRCLVMSLKMAGVTVYSLLPMAPGIFEFQMIKYRDDVENKAFYEEFARLFEDAYDEYMTFFQPKTQDMDLRFGRIVPIEKSLDTSTGIMPLTTDRYSEIVERNNSFSLVNTCACRTEKELLGQGCDRGMHACSAMGWLADMAIEKGIARRVSRQEFMDAKIAAAEAGLVNMVDNLEDPMQVCSCCTCCCGALRMLKEYNIPTIIAKSHFEAWIDQEKCIGCKKCAEACPMDAITVKKKKAYVDYARCIGCGVCVLQCDKGHALSMKERFGHKPPSKNLVAYLAERNEELRGAPNSGLPKLAFGAGSLLYQLSPKHVSGPRYKPKN